MNKKLFFLQLNEFNYDLLKKKSIEQNLSNLKKIFELKYYKYECDAIKEHNGLDPWVQWVNINTGKKYKEHKLKEIGESKNLKHDQIWDILSNNNIKTAVWGTMNSRNNNNNNNLLFCPDPWNFSESFKPRFLKNFLELPSYLLKNFMQFSYLKVLYLFLKFIFALFFTGYFITIFFKSFFIIKFILTRGINKYFFYPIFDWISFCIFLSCKKKYKIEFSIIFINMLASAQHRIWDKSDKKNENDFTFLILDKIIGEIFNLKDENIIISSGLSQKKLEYAYYHYRPINPENFIKSIGIFNFSLRQNMSNDGFLFFENLENLEKAFKTFSSIKINKKNVFLCEKRIIDNKQCLFFIMDFNEKVMQDEVFYSNDRVYKFYDYFLLDVIRTGEHTPICNTFSSFDFEPKEKINTDIFNQIKKYFSA